jgi:hypothetical protein
LDFAFTERFPKPQKQTGKNTETLLSTITAQHSPHDTKVSSCTVSQ